MKRLVPLVILILSLTASLTFLRSGYAQQPPWPDSAAIKSNLKEILSRPEYTPRSEQESDMTKSVRSAVTAVRKKWDQFVAWLQRIWDRLKSLFGGAGGLTGSTGNILIGLFIVLCASGAIYLLVRYFSQQQSTRKGEPLPIAVSVLDDSDDLDAALRHTYGEWLHQAQSFADSQDFRSAVRALFLAQLVALDSAGWIELIKSKTNGDYVLRLTSGSAKLAAPGFRRIADEYERVWYGRHEADKGVYETIRTLGDELGELIKSAAGSAIGVTHVAS